MGERVLIVEDDPVLAESVETMLRHEGFDTTVVHDREAATVCLAGQSPDVVVLELMLPHSGGWDLLNALRQDWPDLPVVMLTARAEMLPESDGEAPGTPAASLQQAANRVRSALLHATMPEVIAKGGIHLDTARHECHVDGHPVFLPPKEFALLAHLMRNAGRVCTREEILTAVWRQRPDLIRVVDVHMRWLRSLVEKDPSAPRWLRTVRGVGYAFVTE